MTPKLRKYLKLLRKRFFACKPVRVRVQSGMEDHGLTWPTDKTFQIRLRQEDGESAMIHTLVHEWAHCCVWDVQDRTGSTDRHDPLFDAMHGEIYRALIDPGEKPAS